MNPDKKKVNVMVVDRVAVGQRISVGLIAASLALISLSLGLAFLNSPAPLLVLAPPISSRYDISSATAVTLQWTAPGDDVNAGQADHYELRYSTVPLTDVSFPLATLVSGVPAPQSAGQTESFTVSSLEPATTYYFGLKTYDEAGNGSAISNIVSKTTDAAAVIACVPTYTCSAWSACVGGQQARTCSVTNGCPAGLDQPITTQACQGPTGGEVTGIRQPYIVAGVGPGTIPVVRLINPTTLKPIKEWLAYSRTNKFGTNPAIGDLDGDGAAEIVVGTGAGSDPMVRLFDTSGHQIVQFNPYSGSRGTGVAVAIDDVNGDSRDDLITIPAAGVSHLRVFTYDPVAKKFTALAQIFVYSRTATMGFSLGSGDLDLDGRAEIVVAPRKNASSVTVLELRLNNQLAQVSRFSPYPTTFSSGLTVAVADPDGNGRADILTVSGPGYYAHIKVVSQGGRIYSSFLPLPTSARYGVDLAAYDVNHDGQEEVLIGAYGHSDPVLRAFRFNRLRSRFEALLSATVYPRTMQSGIRIDAAPHI